jgi:UDP-N-acetylmuramoylalanine--D-glutamate ligase
MIDLKSYVSTLNDKPVAVYGLGLSGMTAARALIAAGARVTAWDDDTEKREQAREMNATIDSMQNLSGYAFLVLSPGIPLHFPQPHPAVLRAREAGVEIIGDVELLHRSGHGLKTIGITGTNGKSTTTALTGHILGACGLDIAVGGNIGKPVLDMDVTGKNAVLLELSSYQLDLCASFSPDIAVHLNLTPDHIDRHGDLKGYVDAKMRIFRGKGIAIMGIDDAHSLAMLDSVQKEGMRDVYGVSATRKVTRGVYVENGILFDCMGEQPVKAGSLSGCAALSGSHNHQNAAASYAVCRLMGIEPRFIMEAMASYPGLPHRMFTTRMINGIAYINDSKATNADAAGKALACYRNIYWILGGRPKEGGLNGLESFMDRIRHAFVIGEASADFSAWLSRYNVNVTSCETLDRAVEAAHRLAQNQRGQPGGLEVVLLSPACSSFDQFQSFEHRGQAFTDLVKNLPEIIQEATE